MVLALTEAVLGGEDTKLKLTLLGDDGRRAAGAHPTRPRDIASERRCTTVTLPSRPTALATLRRSYALLSFRVPSARSSHRLHPLHRLHRPLCTGADLSKVLALPKPAPNRASLVDFATKIQTAAAEDAALGKALNSMKKWKALCLLLF